MTRKQNEDQVIIYLIPNDATRMRVFFFSAASRKDEAPN